MNTATVDNNKAKVEELLHLGQKSYNASDFVTALRHFLEIANIDQNNMTVREKIADTLHKLDKRDESLKMYKEIAEAYLTQGSIIKAIAIHKTILSIDPNDQEIKDQLISIFGSQLPDELASVVKVKEKPETKSKAPNKPAPPPSVASKKKITSENLTADDLGLEGLDEDEPEAAPESFDELNEVFSEILGEDAALSAFGNQPASDDPTEAIMRTPLFSEFKLEEFNSLIDQFELCTFSSDDVICAEGDQGHELWFIVQGGVNISVKGKDGESIHLAELEEGDFFGEGGFTTGAPRSASVTAKDEVKALKMTREKFDVAAKKYPRMNEVIEVFYRNRMADRVMAQSKIFGILPNFRRAELMQSFEWLDFSANETIMAENSEDGLFFFILSGEVEIQSNGSKLETLGPGDFFGEGPIILKKPQNFSATATKDTKVLSLQKIEVEGIRQMFPDAETILKDTAEERASKLQ